MSDRSKLKRIILDLEDLRDNVRHTDTRDALSRIIMELDQIYIPPEYH